MLVQIVIASLMMMATTVVHALCMLAALRVLRTIHIAKRARGRRWARVDLVAGLVVMMFLASVVEIAMWALIYLQVGELSGLEQALYFSTVTFTTLGYGDLTLGENWRLLASFEAANGIIMFGWTTALIFAFVHRLATQDNDPPTISS